MRNAITGLTVIIAIAGCAAKPLPLSSAAAAVTVVPVSSPSVTVRQPALQVSAGTLQLVGFVVKVYEAKTTESTHLDVVFLDEGGRLLAERPAPFFPQRLISARRAPNRQGHYSVPIDELPRGTARIEVRAHDEPHTSPSAR